jgi:hypothetical protein
MLFQRRDIYVFIRVDIITLFTFFGTSIYLDIYGNLCIKFKISFQCYLQINAASTDIYEDCFFTYLHIKQLSLPNHFTKKLALGP